MTFYDLLWYTSLLGFFVFCLFIALATARKEISHLEKELSTFKEIAATAKSDSATWRSLAEKQGEEARQQASTLQSRLEALQQQVDQKQQEIELARQMCRDLPAAKARTLELEKELAVERHRLDQLLPLVAAADTQDQHQHQQSREPESQPPALDAFDFVPSTPFTEIPIASQELEAVTRELHSTRTALDESLRKNTALQQDLTLARFKHRKALLSQKTKARA